MDSEHIDSIQDIAGRVRLLCEDADELLELLSYSAQKQAHIDLARLVWALGLLENSLSQVNK